MGRQPCCDEREGLKKGPWSADEDRKLVAFISSHGLGCWREVPKLAGLLRCGKSCRLRWINYLRPELKRGMLSPEEENLIIQLHASYGNKWSRIAAQLPGRTDNEIKNCWNTRIKKKLKDMGIDPVTHRPLLDMTSVNDPPTNQQRYETGPPSFIQRTGVNVPPSLGHPPLLHREPANTSSAYHYNLMAKRLQEVGLLGTSPNSVMSPPITTSLSHTPPTTKCEEEFSIDYSADSMSHDRSIDSNVQASVHEFSSEEMFPGDTQVMFTGQQNGLHNAPHMLSACQHVPNVHEVHMHPHMQHPSHTSHNAPHMCNPPHVLHNDAHLLQNASHVHPHMLCMSQLRASHPVQPMAHVLPAYQFQEAASLPASSIDDTRMLSSSSRINESIDGCNEGIEGDASAIKEANEHMMTSNYTRNVPPYLNPSMSKYLQEGGVPQASQLYELKHEEATSTGISSTQGQWSNMVSEMMFSAEPEPVGEIYETSQALGQDNFSSSCNSFNNMGQWSNMDCLWGDPMPLTN